MAKLYGKSALLTIIEHGSQLSPELLEHFMLFEYEVELNQSNFLEALGPFLDASASVRVRALYSQCASSNGDIERVFSIAKLVDLGTKNRTSPSRMVQQVILHQFVE